MNDGPTVSTYLRDMTGGDYVPTGLPWYWSATVFFRGAAFTCGGWSATEQAAQNKMDAYVADASVRIDPFAQYRDRIDREGQAT